MTHFSVGSKKQINSINQKIVVKVPSHSALKYSVFLNNSFNNLLKILPKNVSKIIIITDSKVKKLYGIDLLHFLKKANYNCLLASFPAGEKYKNNDTKQNIENLMLMKGCDRHSLIIALGGGVVGDMAGFIAATYLRGIRYVQMPTTLLAIIDSSVGGKTGINTPLGKNLIGAIYPPLAVYVNLAFMKTLPHKHTINGLIEAIKIFLTHDKKYFFYLEKNLDRILNGDTTYLNKIICRAVTLKASIVFRDEQEQGERSLLNFGHTIGHALEKISHYKLLHGHAVGYGMLLESYVSNLANLLSAAHLQKIIILLQQLGIHGKNLQKYSIKDIIKATYYDKKMRDSKVHYVLLKKIGCASVAKKKYVYFIPDNIVQQAFLKIIQG